MSEITWAELTVRDREVLRLISDGKRGETFEDESELFNHGLITGKITHSMVLTDLGRAVLAQADSAKPPIIDAATFANEHYDSKIANGECIVRDGYGDIVRNVKLTICIMSGTYRVTEQDGCDYLMHRSSSANKFTVTWLAQADSAKPEGDAWGKPSRVRETDIEALESDLNDAIETHQRDIVRIATLSTEIDTLQTDLATAREQVARLRAALEDATRAISTSLELVKRVDNQLDTITFNMKQVVRVEPEGVTRAVDNIRRDSKNAVTRLGIGQQEAAAVLAGDEGGA